ncbi:MAG: tetratricopeptide repeat protein [Gemmatimonadales bacterium]|nr:tetratricopeptide repeat protein [Gemmatimonadales bacterium]
MAKRSALASFIPMIELHTLGVLDLRATDGREVRTVLQQPKRLGILAYLAADPPRRFHRRDSLLALFWPDLDEGHARAALRRSLHFLRSALGADILAGRGDEEVGVPEEGLWCDATALDQSLQGGDPERAMALYRGPFLDGLHVEGAASDFQDWLDRERDRLRRQGSAAAALLMERAEREGRAADAARWARRALELTPDDESSLRRLLALLDRAGDRPAAMQAYDSFARRMAQELELEPAPETQALAESIRARAGSAEAGAAGTIAVLPFAVRGDPRFGYLGEGMVDLLATKLDGAGAIRAVDPRALLHFLRRTGLSTADTVGPAGGRAVAEHFRAGHYLLGSIVEAGGRLEATASLYRRDGSAAAAGAAAHASASSETDLFELVDEISRQLLASQKLAPGTRLGRIAALTTGSLDALRAYLQGERELRSGRYFDAMERFQAAVEADPSFALAHYRLAAAAAGCALPSLARESADRSHEHRARLSPHDHLVLSAQRAWLDGAIGEAESLYTTTTGTYPDDVEAWFHLGDLLFHLNPMRGRSAAEARKPFERVVALQPDHAGALVHLARIAAIEERKDEMLDLVARILRVSPGGDQALAMRALRAHTAHDQAGIEAAGRELQSARAITVAIAFSDVALYSGNLDGAETLARQFIEVPRSPELQALCYIQLAHLALARGRRDSALAELAQAERLDGVWGLEMRGLFATLSFTPADHAELREVQKALAAWDAAAAPPSSFPIFAMHNELHPTIREYLLGLICVRLDDIAGAGAHSATLSHMAPGDGGLTDCLSAELAATIARAEGKVGQALAMLERSRPRLWFQLTVASPFFSLASRRFLQAELLRQAGRLVEAAGWYGSIAQRSPYELIYAAPARARLLEMRGLSS